MLQTVEQIRWGDYREGQKHFSHSKREGDRSGASLATSGFGRGQW